MSIAGALIFISLGVGGASLNIYTEVGLVTLMGLISKHGILIVEFANELQQRGQVASARRSRRPPRIRLRPILMTTAAMVLGVVPLIVATGAGAAVALQHGPGDRHAASRSARCSRCSWCRPSTDAGRRPFEEAGGRRPRRRGPGGLRREADAFMFLSHRPSRSSPSSSFMFLSPLGGEVR